MASFQKRNATIEAVQWMGDIDSRSECVKFSEMVTWKDSSPDKLYVRTANGETVVHLGDWIARQPIPGGSMDVWPINAAAFAATYDPHDDLPVYAPCILGGHIEHREEMDEVWLELNGKRGKGLACRLHINLPNMSIPGRPSVQ